jgi:hypothetical protein
VPLVAGHTATITSLSGARPAPGSSLRAGAAAAAGLVASTAEDGALRVWHVGKQVSGKECVMGGCHSLFTMHPV